MSLLIRNLISFQMTLQKSENAFMEFSNGGKLGILKLK